MVVTPSETTTDLTVFPAHFSPLPEKSVIGPVPEIVKASVSLSYVHVTLAPQEPEVSKSAETSDSSVVNTKNTAIENTKARIIMPNRNGAFPLRKTPQMGTDVPS